MVASIERGTDHFCFFAPGPEIAIPFAVCEENIMSTEWGTSRFSTWLTMYYHSLYIFLFSNKILRTGCRATRDKNNFSIIPQCGTQSYVSIPYQSEHSP